MRFLVIPSLLFQTWHNDERDIADVRIPDIRNGDEDLKRILLVWFSDATLYVSLDFGLTFFAVTMTWYSSEGFEM